MTSVELENLIRPGQLKSEAPVALEIRGLLRSGGARLRTASRQVQGQEDPSPADHRVGDTIAAR